MTLRLFLSYDSDDHILVRRLKDGIENRIEGDIEVYIFEEDPSPGALPSTKAMEGIKESDAFLVLLTPNSQKSPWVQQEVGFAKGEDCDIIPIVLDHPETELTGLLTGTEYLPVEKENPETFFDTFQQYAEDKWETQLGGRNQSNGLVELDDEDEDDVHPILAGLPVGRHLTFTRLHALELGLYIGVIAYIAVWLTVPEVIENYPEHVFGVLLFGGLRVYHSKWRVGRDGTAADHHLGLHDLVRAPLSAIVTALYVLWLSTPVLI